MNKKFLIIIIFVFLGLAASLGYHFYSAKSAPAAPQSGLVGYWSMDANDVNGTIVYDKSGYGHNGTRIGALGANDTPQITGGKIKQALNFDGTDDFINAGATVGDYTDNFTLSAWIKTSTDNVRIMARRSGPTQYDFHVAASTGQLALWTGVQYASGVVVDDNKWHLTTVVINGANSKFYVDGVQAGSAFSPTITSQPAVPFAIGALSTPAAYFPGLIDDVRVYNRALSATKVSQLYNSAKTGYVASAPQTASSTAGRLVGWWTLDANDYNSATKAFYDKSGTGNTLTSTNAATFTQGKINQAMSFDGLTDVLSRSSPSGLPAGSSARTISAWIYMTENCAVFGEGGALLQYGDGTGGGQEYTLQASNFAGTCYLFSDAINVANNLTITGSQIPTPNAWHHLVFTLASDGLAYRYYLDGVLVGPGNFSTQISTATPTILNIGDRTDTVVANWPGRVDDFRIYNYALSAQEVAQLYNSTKTGYISSAPMTGLIGWWKMDTDDMSATGATMFDKSGQGNNGTVTGTTTSTGKIGQARSFNGTSDYVNLGAPSIFNFGDGNFAFSAWIKLSTLTAPAATHAYIILGKDSSAASPARQFLFGLSDTKLPDIVYFTTSDITYVYFTGTKAISDMSWHHIVAQRNGNSFDVYVDGVSTGSGTTGGTHGTMQVTATNLEIGRRNYATFMDYFPGAIDDVRIYNRALSAQEVAQLYSSAKKAYIK